MVDLDLDALEIGDGDGEDRAVVGANVVRLRKEAGLSQTQLAQQMNETGCSWYQTTVSRVERGRQSLDVAEMQVLTDILGSGVLAGTQFERTMQKFTQKFPLLWILSRLQRADQALAVATEQLAEIRQYASGSLTDIEDGEDHV